MIIQVTDLPPGIHVKDFHLSLGRADGEPLADRRRENSCDIRDGFPCIRQCTHLTDLRPVVQIPAEWSPFTVNMNRLSGENSRLT